jgi:hypothetical protein
MNGHRLTPAKIAEKTSANQGGSSALRSLWKLKKACEADFAPALTEALDGEFENNRMSMEKMTKEKLGKALYLTPPILLVLILILLLSGTWTPSKRTFLLIGSGCFIITTVSSLLTNDIGIQGVGAVKKSADPKAFRAQFLLQCFLAVFSFILGLLADE